MKKNKSSQKLPQSATSVIKHPKDGAAKYVTPAVLFENRSIHLILLALIPLLVYFKSIYFEFIYDDLLIKNNSTTLARFGSILEAFQRDAFFQKPGTTFYRPMQLVSFVFDSMISGADPWMFHLTNILILIASTLSLYFLLNLLDLQKKTAFIAALIFSIHPLLGGAVSWVSARGDLLIGLLGLWLVITMIYYSRTANPVFIAVHAVCFFCAVFSKETASLFPLLLGVFYFLFLRRKEKPLRLSIFASIWFIVLIVYYYMKTTYVHEHWEKNVIGVHALIDNLPYFAVLISRTFLPINLPLWPRYDLFAIVSGSFLVLVLGYLMYYSLRKNWKLPIFGMLWLLIMTFPHVIYRPANFAHDIVQLEQRNFLPLMGFFILFAFFYQQWSGSYKRQSALLVIGIVLAFSVLTVAHTDDYSNVFNFTTAAIKKNPECSAAYTYRGFAYSEQKDFAKAFEDFDKAIDISQYKLAYMDRAWTRGLTGDFAGAEADYTECIKKDSNSISAFRWRAEARRRIGKFDEALQDLYRAKSMNQKDFEICSAIGWINNDQQKFQQAVPLFNQALALAPNDTRSFQGRAFANMNLGNFQAVVSDCKAVLRNEPDNIDFYNHLGDAERMLQHYPEAIAAYSSAIEHNPSRGESYFLRGLAREALKDITGAKKDWESALKLGYEPARALISKY